MILNGSGWTRGKDLNGGWGGGGDVESKTKEINSK